MTLEKELKQLRGRAQDLLIHYEECRAATEGKRFYRVRRLLRKGESAQSLQTELAALLEKYPGQVAQEIIDPIERRFNQLTTSPEYSSVHQDITSWKTVFSEWKRLHGLNKTVQALEKHSHALDEATQLVTDYTERAAKEKTKFLKHLYEDKARKYQEKAAHALKKVQDFIPEHFGIQETLLNQAVVQIRETILGSKTEQSLTKGLISALGRFGRVHEQLYEKCDQALRQIEGIVSRSNSRMVLVQAKVHPEMFKLEGDLRYAFHVDDVRRLRTDLGHLRTLLSQPNEPTQKRMKDFEESLKDREQWLTNPANAREVARELREAKAGLEQQIRSVNSLAHQAEGHMKEDVSSILRLQKARFEKLDQIPMAEVVHAVPAC